MIKKKLPLQFRKRLFFMKNFITLLFLAIYSSFFAQIKGTVTDIKGRTNALCKYLSRQYRNWNHDK